METGRNIFKGLKTLSRKKILVIKDVIIFDNSETLSYPLEILIENYLIFSVFTAYTKYSTGSFLLL